MPAVFAEFKAYRKAGSALLEHQDMEFTVERVQIMDAANARAQAHRAGAQDRRYGERESSRATTLDAISTRPRSTILLDRRTPRSDTPF